MNVIKLFFKACIVLVCMICGQKAVAQLSKTVRVPVQNVDVDALGDIITRQTGLILSFNSQKIGARQLVRLRKPAYTIQQLLTLIKDATDADYTIYKEHVIFHRKVAERRIVTAPKTPAKPVKPVTPAKPKLVKSVPVAKVAKAPTPVTVANKQNAPMPVPVIKKATPPFIHPVFIGQQPVQAPGLVSPLPSIACAAMAIASKPASEKEGLFSLLTRAGIAADETFYLNTEARVGITLLYAIGGWSSNFSVSGFRYGVGSSYPLGHDWRIQLEATTGRLSKTVRIQEPFDTINNSTARLDIENKLHRVSFFAEKRVGRHWTIHAGPVFNYLKSSSALSENRAPFIYYLPGDAPVDDTYHIIKPPYTLSRRTTEDRLVTTSTWIGVQAGAYFRF